MAKVILILGGMAILFGMIAAYFYYESHKLMSEGGTASGTVVKMEHSSSRSYYPIINFQASAGQIVEGRSRVGSSPPQFTAGQTVQVFYDKSNPKNWILNSWLDLYFLPTLFGAFSGGLALATTIMLIYRNRRRTR